MAFFFSFRAEVTLPSQQLSADSLAIVDQNIENRLLGDGIIASGNKLLTSVSMFDTILVLISMIVVTMFTKNESGYCQKDFVCRR